jgi:virginiamycin B lyase
MKLPVRRAAVLATALTALLAATATTAVAAPRLKEYSLRSASAVPADIAVGPDGALYSPDGSLGRLWRITTKGKLSSVDLGGVPAGVATGADGALWVTDRTSPARIQRVTPSGAVTDYPLPDAGAFPTDIVSGPDGALWFTETRADKIGRITTGGVISEYPLGTTDAFAADITVGPDGALWFTEQSGNKVGRVTTSGQVTEFALSTPDSLPGPITAGADGAIYFGERNSNVITRMTTAGVITNRYPLPTDNADPLSLVSAPGGDLLIAQHSAGTIGRMHLDGTFARDVRTKSAPDAATLGPDGALWYAASDDGAIGRYEFDR